MHHEKTWLLTGHLVGILLWIGGMMTVYWVQRAQSHAPANARDQLTALQRSLALLMDLAATLAIATGVAMIVRPINLLVLPPAGWLHAKLALVVLGVLPVHGMVRARVSKFSRGQTPTVPQWQWSLLLVASVAIVILVVQQPF